MSGDHPHTDPGDGRTECQTCGKWVFEAIHSCKRVPVTEAAMRRALSRLEGDEQAMTDSPLTRLRAALDYADRTGWPDTNVKANDLAWALARIKETDDE